MNEFEEQSAPACQPAFSMYAEQAVLGGLMLDNRLFDLCEDLTPEQFFFEDFRKVFGAAHGLMLTGKVADPLTVFEALPADSGIGIDQLNELCQFIPSQKSFRSHVEIIRGMALTRRLIAAGEQITDLASDARKDFDERLEQAASLLAGLQSQEQDDDWRTAADEMIKHTAVLEDRREGRITAWPTGLTDFDEVLDGGLVPGNLYVIGARPSMGKTAFGMSIGLHMARTHWVGMLSMEMPFSDLNDRITAMLSHVPMNHIKRPHKGLQWDRVVEGVDRARDLLWNASDKSNLTIGKVRVMAKRLQRKSGLQVLLVDYIGLMAGTYPNQPRAYQIEEISRGLKSLAKELGIAVICLAQVNRKVEERADSVPGLSDLRDSGAIEQDADVVAFIHRPIQVKPDLGSEWTNYAKLSVAKNRQGRSGCVVNLAYIGEQTRFANWSGQPPTSQVRIAKKGMRDE